jgi:sulfur carrier protein ThiS
VRRKDGGDADEVLGGDTCVPQCQLEGGETLFVLANAFGEEEACGDHVLAQVEDPPGDVAGYGEARWVRLRDRVELVKVITGGWADV